MLSPPPVEADIANEATLGDNSTSNIDVANNDNNHDDDPPATATALEEGTAPVADSPNPTAATTAEQSPDKDDDDVTVIVLDHSPEDANGQRLTIAWTGEAGPQVEERRRQIMLQELQRVQRTSFLHFLILCLIPTVLLFIVIATVISEDEECYSEATVCHKEARSFINAFTTRCVCEAIAVPRSG